MTLRSKKISNGWQFYYGAEYELSRAWQFLFHFHLRAPSRNLFARATSLRENNVKALVEVLNHLIKMFFLSQLL